MQPEATTTQLPPTPQQAPSFQSVDALDQEPQTSIGTQIYADICVQIILGQQEIIGDLAVDQAKLVPGLTVTTAAGQIQCSLVGEPISIIDRLIAQYQDFFGHAAVEVCKEAASQLLIKLPHTEIPASLR